MADYLQHQKADDWTELTELPGFEVTTMGYGGLSDTNGNTLVIPPKVRLHHRHYRPQG